MNYYLDTDICIFALKDEFPTIKKELHGFTPEDIKIPSLVQAELLLGALKSANPRQEITIVERFLSPYEIIPFGKQEAVVYAKIRCDLEKKGTSIGPNDLIVAATVLAHQGVLVTHNTKEFDRIAGLLTQDWTKQAS